MKSKPFNGACTIGDSTPNRGERSNDVPIIIVGAGPVGLMLAVLLAGKNISSVVIEKNEQLDSTPRALLHYPPTLDVFKTAGIYDTVLGHGLISRGIHYRKRLDCTNKDNPSLGESVALLETTKPQPDGRLDETKCAVAYAQSLLSKLLLQKAVESKLVQVHFDAKVTKLEEDVHGITVFVDTAQGNQTMRAQYLAACDGGRSTIRNLLGIQFTGFTWPGRLLATDVERTITEVEDIPSYYVIDRAEWAVVTPMEPVYPGKPAMWRYAFPITDESLTDEEVNDKEYVKKQLLKYIEGPRPGNHVLVQNRTWKIHQLQAATMHRGRVVLAGDAAHLNNPVGGYGLNTGLLDADLLHNVFDQIFNESYHDPHELLAEYSAARRSVFQNVVIPLTYAGKIRLHENDPDRAIKEDWYFRMLRRGNPVEIAKAHEPLRHWRTNVQDIMTTQNTNEIAS
ncbi:hypothetical protein LTS18_009558 [Coniosporium uncinatum]|uniref:Uncharacterized protein n=1 Tax=Coniosporium uncinatum TaxID=93489 RepID=A0ACC3DZ88_9PEZI|nr:hypothetical protein LTS18_009558 [Coniosporium uncinatum]